MATSEELISLNAAHNYYVQRLAAQYGNDAIPYINTMQDDIEILFIREVGKTLTDIRHKKLLDVIKQTTKNYLRD